MITDGAVEISGGGIRDQLQRQLRQLIDGASFRNVSVTLMFSWL